MATGLGHGLANSIIFSAKNLTGSTLVKGQIVGLSLSEMTFAAGLDSDPVYDIVLQNLVDNTAGQGGLSHGVCRRNIGDDEIGQIVIFGLAQVISATAEAPGVVMTTIAGGIVSDAAGASHESPCALTIETISAADVTAATPRWMFVDFIGNSCHGVHSAGDTFHGVAY